MVTAGLCFSRNGNFPSRIPPPTFDVGEFLPGFNPCPELLRSQDRMTQAKKVFIRTFGCQMNEYDSDKMADVLAAAEGFEKTSDPAEADLILFNTCSVREKAQEKVFADLGRVRPLKARSPGSSSASGVRREPGGSGNRPPRALRRPRLGPQTLHRLPQLIAERRASGRPQVDISFPEIEKFDHLPPARTQGASAFVSIMEGCSKYCTFCVVPYTRGEEVSRPFDGVLAEIGHLAAQGVKEVTLLGQNVNAYRGKPSGRRGRGLRASLGARGPDGRRRAHSLHDLASARIRPAPDRRAREAAETRRACPPSGAVGIGSRARRDEAGLHGDRIQGDGAKAPRRTPRHLDFQRFHRGLPRRSPADFEKTMNLVEDVRFDGSFSFIFSARPGTPAASFVDETPAAEKARAPATAAGSAPRARERTFERHGGNAPARPRGRTLQEERPRAAGGPATTGS